MAARDHDGLEPDARADDPRYESGRDVPNTMPLQLVEQQFTILLVLGRATGIAVRGTLPPRKFTN
jgi:hypothetical protein